MAVEISQYIDKGKDGAVLKKFTMGDGESKTVEGTSLMIFTRDYETKVVSRIKGRWEMNVPKKRVKIGYINDANKQYTGLLKVYLEQGDFINFYSASNDDIIGIRHVDTSKIDISIHERDGWIIENQD